ncbi:hypothetical protein ACN47E_000378 [Coniothyrium glycines]
MSHESRTADHDADHQLALNLSAELNDDHVQAPAADMDYDADADFALALQLQFENEASDVIDASTDFFVEDSSWNSRSSADPLPEATTWDFEKDDTRAAEYQSESSAVHSPIDTFADFTKCLKSFTCSKCGHDMLESSLSVQQLFRGWLNDKVRLSSLVTCKHCQTSSCISCTPAAFVKPSRLVVRGKQVSWCCAGGRLLVMWMLLCGFDPQYLGKKTTASSQAVVKASANKGKSSRRSRGGVGYGGGRRPYFSSMPSGTGFDSDDMSDFNTGDFEYKMMAHSAFLSTFDSNGQVPNDAGHRSSISQRGKLSPRDAQRAHDAFGTVVLGLLKGLLPSVERNTGFDLEPPSAVADMLARSQILSYCAELLRNDSLNDAMKRDDIYTALIDLLLATGSSFITMRSMFRKRPVWPDGLSLQSVSFDGEQTTSGEMASSLADCARNLITQSNIVLQSARTDDRDFRSVDGQNLLWLCRRISELDQFIQAYGARDQRKDSPRVEAIKPVPDEQIFAAYAYATKAKALDTSAPGRFRRLVKEITTLKTGLPPGIFVRYCEDRLDVMKFCIIGPKGTPYENGMFAFDMFCGADFPKSPPMVCFKGTAGGRISINPNLYADGKVCLSLLGTWSGEPWNPSLSTLLQILVSIQAMIFCDEPWYNEPGREATYKGDSENSPSATYNRRLHDKTVNYAMLAWLDGMPPLWKELVVQHFHDNGNKILQTVSEWAKAIIHYDNETQKLLEKNAMDKVMGRRAKSESNGFPTMLFRLQHALKPYGATFVIPELPRAIVAQPAQTRNQWNLQIGPATLGTYPSPSAPPFQFGGAYPPSTPAYNWGSFGHPPVPGPVSESTLIFPLGLPASPIIPGSANVGGAGIIHPQSPWNMYNHGPPVHMYPGYGNISPHNLPFPQGGAPMGRGQGVPVGPATNFVAPPMVNPSYPMGSAQAQIAGGRGSLPPRGTFSFGHGDLGRGRGTGP